MADENYYGADDSGMPATEMGPAPVYRSPAAAGLSEADRSYKIDSIYSNVMAMRGRTDNIPLSPMSGPPMYGDAQAMYTNMRASYGDSPMMGAYFGGAVGGIQTVGGGAMVGANRMMSDLGSMIRPMTYTPPARVYSGFSGRVMQETSFWGSFKAMTGISDPPRATSPYLYAMTGAADVGERVGGAMAGLGVTAGVLGASAIGSKIGGAALGGLVGTVAGGLAGYAVGGFAADKIYEGMAARREVQDYLERTSDLYVTAGSAAADPRRGAGFSRAARRDVSEYIRELDIKDRMMGTEDLSAVLKGATEMGLFSGVRETEDFKKKFKTIVENVKVVATTLNTTLEEGLKVMKDFKGIGVDSGAVGGLVLQAQTFGKMAGRTASEMVNIGLQGAEIFRGTGVSMQIGYQANVMNLASIRAARDANLISQEAIAQAGGEEALAQRMTGSTMAYTQSAMGRGFGGLYYRQGTGFDQGAFMGALTGKMDMGEAAHRATQNLSSPRAMIEYEVNQERFRSQQGKMFGGRGLDIGMMNEALMQASSIAQWTGTDMTTATRYILKSQMGLSESETEARLAQLKDPEKFLKNQQAAALAVRNQTLSDQSYNNFVFTRFGAYVGDVIKKGADYVAAPLNRMVDDMSEVMQSFTEQELFGQQRFDISGTGYGAFERAGSLLTGEAEKRRESERRLELGLTKTRGGSYRKISVDLDKGGVFAETAGEALSDALASARGKKGNLFSGVKTSRTSVLSEVSPEVSLDRNIVTGMVTGIETKELRRVSQLARVVSSISAETAREMDKEGLLKDILPKAQEKFIALGVSGRAAKLSNEEMFREIFGKDMSQATAAEFASYQRLVEGSDRSKDLEESRKTAISIRAAEGAVDVAMQQEYTKNIQMAQEKLGFGQVKSADAKAFLAMAITEKDEVKKADLLKKAAAAAYASPEDRNLISSGAWRKIEESAKGASRDKTLAAETLVENLRDSEVLRQKMGSVLGVEALGVELKGMDKLPETVKSQILGIADKLAVGGGDSFREYVKSPDFQKNQELLSQTVIGNDIASRAYGVKASQILEKAGSSDESRKKALSEANIPTSLHETFISQFKERGASAMTEELISRPKELAGTSGVAAAGAAAGIGTGSAAGSAQDQLAVQTSINLVTYKAFEALARKLGVQ